MSDLKTGATSEGDRQSRPVITFLTDFGWDGGLRRCLRGGDGLYPPRAHVLHVSHEIAVGDVGYGALVLRRVAPLCPAAVHLAVVDPGVGTTRRPLVLTTGGETSWSDPITGCFRPRQKRWGK